MNKIEYLKEKQSILKSMEDTICITRDEARIICDALEKQMPIKCVKDDCKRDCCPVCGWIIGYGDTIQPHCHNCGQALDWSGQ